MSEEEPLAGEDEPAPVGALADTGERELTRERIDTVLVVFTLLGVCLYLPVTWWLLRVRAIAAFAVSGGATRMRLVQRWRGGLLVQATRGDSALSIFLGRGSHPGAAWLARVVPVSHPRGSFSNELALSNERWPSRTVPGTRVPKLPATASEP